MIVFELGVQECHQGKSSRAEQVAAGPCLTTGMTSPNSVTEAVCAVAAQRASLKPQSGQVGKLAADLPMGWSPSGGVATCKKNWALGLFYWVRVGGEEFGQAPPQSWWPSLWPLHLSPPIHHWFFWGRKVRAPWHALATWQVTCKPIYCITYQIISDYQCICLNTFPPSCPPLSWYITYVASGNQFDSLQMARVRTLLNSFRKHLVDFEHYNLLLAGGLRCLDAIVRCYAI
jgi:hypothetical protein